jgi:hypothetical protein
LEDYRITIYASKKEIYVIENAMFIPQDDKKITRLKVAHYNKINK